MTEEELAALEARIADIEQMIDSGVTSITVDGTATAISQTALRKRLIELKAQRPDAPSQRPRAARIHLGGW